MIMHRPLILRSFAYQNNLEENIEIDNSPKFILINYYHL